MKRYLKILSILMRNAVIRDSKIPGFVAVSILQELISIVVNIVFFDVIFSNIDSLAGWSFYQVLFLYAFSKTVASLSYAFTRYGLKDMGANMVKRGEFDFYLAKPIDTMWLVSFSRPKPTKLIAVLFYAALGVFCVFKAGIPVGIDNILWFALLFLVALILFYFLEIITIVPAFKLIRVWSLPNITPRLSEFMRYPIGIFSLPLQAILYVVFPIIAASYIPSSALFYPPKLISSVYLVLITAVFFIIVRGSWRWGERNYSSASS